jgi:hypothetical protein
MSDGGEASDIQRAGMVDAVQELLASFAPDQRAAATGPLDVPDHRHLTYLPGPRPGCAWPTCPSHSNTLRWLCSTQVRAPSGAVTARGVIDLDMIRRQLSASPGLEPRAGDHRYWIRVLGDVAGIRPWAWRWPLNDPRSNCGNPLKIAET